KAGIKPRNHTQSINPLSTPRLDRTHVVLLGASECKISLPKDFFETVAKVNSLVDFGGKADKKHFDRAE
ncbi:hypothetical protein, partial [Porphyromonas pogonae]|uniref:hypothetical protein n=1 Tax=Porphyromonas pogonae TaxID=867595 RepID=UPI00300E7DE8